MELLVVPSAKFIAGMITAVYAYGKVIGVLGKKPRRLGVAPSVIPGNKSNFGEEVVDLHLLQELFIVEAAISGSKKWIIQDEAGQCFSGGFHT